MVVRLPASQLTDEGSEPACCSKATLLHGNSQAPAVALRQPPEGLLAVEHHMGRVAPVVPALEIDPVAQETGHHAQPSTGPQQGVETGKLVKPA
jgi:hypothetical protein